MHIISQRRRAAGVAIHGLVSLIKISRAPACRRCRDSRLNQSDKNFPGTAIPFQPELHQNYSKPIANFTQSQPACRRCRNSRLSQSDKNFPGTAIPFQPELHQNYSKPIANFTQSHLIMRFLNSAERAAAQVALLYRRSESKHIFMEKIICQPSAAFQSPFQALHLSGYNPSLFRHGMRCMLSYQNILYL